MDAAHLLLGLTGEGSREPRCSPTRVKRNCVKRNCVKRKYLSDRQKLTLLKWQKFCCVGPECQGHQRLPPVVEFDHVLPLSEGGSNDFFVTPDGQVQGNWRALCPNCHRIVTRGVSSLGKRKTTDNLEVVVDKLVRQLKQGRRQVAELVAKVDRCEQDMKVMRGLLHAKPRPRLEPLEADSGNTEEPRVHVVDGYTAIKYRRKLWVPATFRCIDRKEFRTLSAFTMRVCRQGVEKLCKETVPVGVWNDMMRKLQCGACMRTLYSLADIRNTCVAQNTSLTTL